MRLGKPYLYTSLVHPWVLNFPTKDHWRSVTNLEDIVKGLEYLVRHYEEWGITSLAVPPLGCGEGRLDWRIVGPTLYRYLSQLEIPVKMYAPFGTKPEELRAEFLQGRASLTVEASRDMRPQRVSVAWLVVLEILHRIEQEPYHWPVGRTIFQKIVFVASDQGVPTGLNYRKGSYGPFAPDLKMYYTRLVNHGLVKEIKRGNMFQVKLGPTFHDFRERHRAELVPFESLVERIVDLFLIMDTTQAELAASVIFAAKILQAEQSTKPSEYDVLRFIMDWKKRRRPPLDEKEVAWTIRNLVALRWLPVQVSKDLPIPEQYAA